MYYEITTLVATSALSVAGCVGFILWHFRRSRCIHIKLGCLECTRDVMTTNEMKHDVFRLPKFREASRLPDQSEIIDMKLQSNDMNQEMIREDDEDEDVERNEPQTRDKRTQIQTDENKKFCIIS